MSSILLVDDHAVVRNGLKQMLIENLGSVVLGEANDAIEAMRAGSKARLGPSRTGYPSTRPQWCRCSKTN